MESTSSDEDNGSGNSKKSEKVEPVKSKTPQVTPRGKISRNPFLNYLREFRATHKGLSSVEVARQGSIEWNKLSEAEKFKFVQQATAVPKRKGGRKRKHRSASPATTDSTTTGSESEASSYALKKGRYQSSKKTNKARSGRYTQRKHGDYSHHRNVTSSDSESSDGDKIRSGSINVKSKSSDENLCSKSEKSAKSEKVEPVKSKTPKATQQGKLSRHPFLTYLREFRATRRGLSDAQIIKQGLTEWKKLSGAEKLIFVQQSTTVSKQKINVESNSSDENSRCSKSKKSGKLVKSKKIEAVKSKTSQATAEEKLSRHPFLTFLRDFQATCKEPKRVPIIEQRLIEWKILGKLDRFKSAQQPTTVPKQKVVTKIKHKSASLTSTESSSKSETDDSS